MTYLPVVHGHDGRGGVCDLRQIGRALLGDIADRGAGGWQ
jgi:hypothetical protein